MKDMEKNIYENVPGQGKRLEDGTWWVNCRAKVGEVHKMNPGHYIRVCQVIETGIFDGLPFARWKRLPDEQVNK